MACLASSSEIPGMCRPLENGVRGFDELPFCVIFGLAIGCKTSSDRRVDVV